MKGISQRALILGVTGQDGALLASHLLDRGYDVHGTSRRQGHPRNLQALGIAERVSMHALDPLDRAKVTELIGAVRPFEIYNLSGQSSVGASFARPLETFDSHVGPTIAVLDAVRSHSLDCRFFHASSGEIFGETGPAGADESAVVAPRSPYAVAKAAATTIVKGYREMFGLFACSAFMFNHESLLRPDSFVVQRIARGAAAIKLKRATSLALGNLKIVRDWGWAPDYVECFGKMLQHDEPTDFVVATGMATSLEQVVDTIFGRFDLDWKHHVVSDPALFRPTDIGVSFGRPQLAAQRLGWSARVRMPEIAERLADAALGYGGADARAVNT